ncbi:hypothetical protein [Rhodococcus marinonascens]|uniref:hypothetical protein n=1 Tax=Rhodococcus marinonascens TaxID=38311 RepID=UPI000932422B|nr:hypothetical protein [Rhodococcus marinonascens]
MTKLRTDESGRSPENKPLILAMTSSRATRSGSRTAPVPAVPPRFDLHADIDGGVLYVHPMMAEIVDGDRRQVHRNGILAAGELGCKQLEVDRELLEPQVLLVEQLRQELVLADIGADVLTEHVQLVDRHLVRRFDR